MKLSISQRLICIILAVSFLFCLLPSTIIQAEAASRVELSNPNNVSRNDILTEARKWKNVGATYWSASSPWPKCIAWRTGFTTDGQTSFDCCGFVCRVMNDLGFRGKSIVANYSCILRDKYGAYFIDSTIAGLLNYGTDITAAVQKAKNDDFSDLLPGDIIGWKDLGYIDDHIIIYAGYNSSGKPTMIEFTGSGYREREITDSYKNAFRWGARFVTCNCEDNYNSVGKCKLCGNTYNWEASLDTTKAGIYKLTGDHYIRTTGPYDDATWADTKTKKGTEVTVLGTVVNHFGNTWYKLSNGYIYGTWAEKVSNLPSNISINITWPAEGQTIPKASHNLEGTITSSVNIKSASVYVDGTCYGTDYPNSTTLNLKRSQMDLGLPFNNLSSGKHTMKITVTDVNGTSKTVTRIFYTESVGTHTHDKGTFLYYEAAHPHNNCYKCSVCGETWKDTGSSNKLSNCTTCQKPGKPAFNNLDSEYAQESPITFTWTSTNNTTHYNFYLYKMDSNGNWNVNEHTYYVESGFTRTLGEGEYRALLQSYNSNAWADDNSDWLYTESDYYYFTVTDTNTPGKPTLLYMEPSYSTEDVIRLEWAETENTTHYNIYVHVQNDDGTYQDAFEPIEYAKSGETLLYNLPEGQYRIRLQATNSNAWDYDENTWMHTNSDYFYFTVSAPVQEWDCAVNGHQYIPMAKEATCEEDGYYIDWCERCNYQRKTFMEPATGHNYSYKITVEPTSSSAGTLVGICSNCSGTESVTLPNLNTADYTYKVTKNATCTETGMGRYTWNTSDYGTFYFDEVIEMEEHDHVSTVIDPTCTEKGYTIFSCSKCGSSMKFLYVDALGHAWDSGKVTKEPAIGIEGIKTFTCSSCGEIRTEGISPLPDESVDDVCKHVSTKMVNQKDATCTATGYTGDKVCTSCGETIEKGTTISMKAHTEVIDKAVAATCTTTGKTEGKHCSVCQTVLKAQDTVPATGHNWSDWEVTKPATGADMGEEKRSCTVCGLEETRSIDKLSNPFVDVQAGKFYETPVLWAVENGVTNGMDETHFAPDNICNRGQVVTFLWRAAGSPEPTSSNNPFTDVKEGKFYYKAVLWAVENGITNGTTETTFSPNDNCTRGQVATFLWRTLNEPAASSSTNPFTDVAQGKFYYDAVLWAVDAGVTNGMTASTFAPNNACTRGQIVTFLYRALG